MYFYCKSLCILIVFYSYCSSVYSYRCLYILIVYVFLDAATLTGVQFEFDQSGAGTCKFRVGDVTAASQPINAAKHYATPHLT
jgi:hypothetical protein